jgi:hypothetical protein
MPESAKFWSKKKKAAFESVVDQTALAELASHFHGKTIPAFAEPR